MALPIRKSWRPQVREELARRIQDRSIAFGLGWADACEVDAINILQATMLAMRRAMLGLRCAPAHVIVDGDRCPSLAGLPFDCSIEAVVAGDASVTCVGAASILAKVARDRFMCELDVRYPGYGFAGHKGYGTPEHLDALRRLGPSPVHRTELRAGTILPSPLIPEPAVHGSPVRPSPRSHRVLARRRRRPHREREGGRRQAAARRPHRRDRAHGDAGGRAHRPGQPLRAGQVLQDRAVEGRQAADRRGRAGARRQRA